MGDFLEIRVIEKIDPDDFEECIAKDYRYYVKLRSREEPYEVTEDTYERVLAWIAEVNAERDGLKRCPFCGSEAIIYERRKLDGSDAFFKYSIGCGNEHCEIKPQTGFWKYKSEAEYSWNRRAE